MHSTLDDVAHAPSLQPSIPQQFLKSFDLPADCVLRQMGLWAAKSFFSSHLSILPLALGGRGPGQNARAAGTLNAAAANPRRSSSLAVAPCPKSYDHSRHLPQCPMRYAYEHRFDHCWMLIEGVFDLDAIFVL